MKKPPKVLVIGVALLIAALAATAVICLPKIKADFAAIAAVGCGYTPLHIGERYTLFPELDWHRSLARTMNSDDPLCSKSATLTGAPWCSVENYAHDPRHVLLRLATNVPPEPAICFTTNGLFTERPDLSGKWMFEKGGRRLVLFYTNLQYRQTWDVQRLTPEQFILCKKSAFTVIFRDTYEPYQPGPSSTPHSDTGSAAAPAAP